MNAKKTTTTKRLSHNRPYSHNLSTDYIFVLYGLVLCIVHIFAFGGLFKNASHSKIVSVRENIQSDIRSKATVNCVFLQQKFGGVRDIGG